ncbi:DUF4396 domain-containing protein [Mangrovibacter yixingensis]|uniref:DUF4396 domain-containing protein n=1 Tax=Mangrovibacter yixingensis TaxID=1529639 RepID=UPI001CFC9D5E|nr:DUF4396 domain-containing protein [Mangrovibacter yixingensis]
MFLYSLIVIASLCTALGIAWDIRHHPQHMKIMSVTWPVTGLYMPVFGWFVWQALGTRQHDHNHHSYHFSRLHRVSWRDACISATHCGAGCVIGDIIAVPFAALTEVTLAGSKFFGHTLVSFVAAFFLGILFQYLPVREMGERSRIRALIKAIKADTISLLVFQAGMFICLWFFRRGDLNSAPDTGSVTFWGQMVVAMFTGYAISVPANYLLLKRGIKHAM